MPFWRLYWCPSLPLAFRGFYQHTNIRFYLRSARTQIFYENPTFRTPTPTLSRRRLRTNDDKWKLLEIFVSFQLKYQLMSWQNNMIYPTSQVRNFYYFINICSIHGQETILNVLTFMFCGQSFSVPFSLRIYKRLSSLSQTPLIEEESGFESSLN